MEKILLAVFIILTSGICSLQAAVVTCYTEGERFNPNAIVIQTSCQLPTAYGPMSSDIEVNSEGISTITVSNNRQSVVFYSSKASCGPIRKVIPDRNWGQEYEGKTLYKVDFETNDYFFVFTYTEPIQLWGATDIEVYRKDSSTNQRLNFRERFDRCTYKY